MSKSYLDRPLYLLLTAEGDVHVGQVWQGTCLLLFTSPDSAAAFVSSSDGAGRPPLVFSRSRAEFLTQAGRAFGQGYIGGLVDLMPDVVATDFVGFDIDRRQVDSLPV
jgi:hypothetical protein